MTRFVTITMEDKKAILLMDFLGMQSASSVQNLCDTIKDSYSDCGVTRFEDDYPNYDPKKAYEIVEKLYMRLSKELNPSDSINISI